MNSCFQQTHTLLAVGMCCEASACVLFFLSSLYHHAAKIGKNKLSTCNALGLYPYKKSENGPEFPDLTTTSAVGQVVLNRNAAKYFWPFKNFFKASRLQTGF